MNESFRTEHFVQNTIRDSDERFVVRIPFKKTINKLEDSQEQAYKIFVGDKICIT